MFRALVICSDLFVAHFLVSSFFILGLANVQWGSGNSPEATPRAILWVINPVFISIIDFFNEGRLSASTFDPYFKEKQIGFLISWPGSSAVIVATGYFIYWFIRRSKKQMQA